MKLKILNLDRHYPVQAQKILKSVGVLTNRQLTHGQLKREVSKYDILIVDAINFVDKKIIDQGKNLKIIATATTGTDHIDVDHARKKKIKIVSLKGEKKFLKSIPATAELTFGLVFALVRQIPGAFADVKKYNWNRPKFRGFDLLDKTFGIIGFGRLGQIVAKYAKAFGMKVIATDPKAKISGVKKVSLTQLLKTADVVSLHVDLTPKNYNLISTKELKSMKKTAVLINTSRGQLIDEKALLQALKQRKIAGAAIDVLADEKKGNKVLVNYAKKNKNLIITPHIGGMTKDSTEKTRIFIAQKIKKAIKK